MALGGCLFLTYAIRLKGSHTTYHMGASWSDDCIGEKLAVDSVYIILT